VSRRYVGRDDTANQAITNADRGRRALHAPGCWVDGGPRRHGRRGFRCARCAEQVEDRLEGLLVVLDSRRPA